MRTVYGLLPALLFLAAVNSYAAPTRCESADGKVSYVDGACPSGTTAARAVIPAAQPAPQDQINATSKATQEYKDAERMRIAREKQERKQMTANAAAEKRANAVTKRCKKLARLLKDAKEDELLITPKDAKTKRRNRAELEEDYAMHCKG
jgi:hypothetical protein